MLQYHIVILFRVLNVEKMQKVIKRYPIDRNEAWARRCSLVVKRKRNGEFLLSGNCWTKGMAYISLDR